MSSVYCPLTNASVVSHAVNVILVKQHETNLVVAKTNVLQIFRLVEREEDLVSKDSADEAELQGAAVETGDDYTAAGLTIRASQRQLATKLVLVSEHQLFGTITSLGVIRAKDFDETGLEYLLVAFETAKASLLCWNQDTNDLETISLHSFEREEFRSPLITSQKSLVRVDPLSRIATMSFSGDHLAFMPISQKDELTITEDTDLDQQQGPIFDSFVLPARQLQDDVTRLIDFTFIAGYREPAIAILYASEGAVPGLLNNWRKDTSKLVVLTLDIQAKERTAIFEIEDLPYDLHSVYAVPDPLGGCLLLGTNEIIYVDSASRVVGLAVNGHAKGASSLPMRDYSSLNLLLEGSIAIPLTSDDGLDGILLVLADGRIALLTLNLDGRTVSSLHLKVVSEDLGANIITSAATCAVVLRNRRLFLGSRGGDSKLVAWKKIARSGDPLLNDSVVPSREEDANKVSQVDEEMDELEDLYGDEGTEKKLFGAEKTIFDLHYFEHDKLRNYGPITGMILGAPYMDEEDDRQIGVGSAAEIALVSGAGRAGQMTICRRHIRPEVIGKFDSPEWQSLWTVKTRSSTENSLDTYLMASEGNVTQVFTIGTTIEAIEDSEFETADGTVSVGTLLDNTWIVQICADMMRTYDADLKLLELKPTPEDCSIVSASIIDPYVLLMLDNCKLALYSGSAKTKELEELSHDLHKHGEIACATLYTSSNGSILDTACKSISLSKKRKRDRIDSTEDGRFCFCLSVTLSGTFFIYELRSSSCVFSAELSKLPPHLRGEGNKTAVNGSSTETKLDRKVSQIMMHDLGQHDRSPFLIIRTQEDDTVVYQPYLDNHGALSFQKVVQDRRNKLDVHDNSIDRPEMVFCEDVGGYACVFLNDAHYPSWLIKTDQSLPTFHAAGIAHVQSLSGFNTMDAPQGFIYCDLDNVSRICRLPDFDYTGNWSTRSIPIGKSVHGIAYYADQQVYAILTSEEERHEIPDEDDEEWQPMQDHLDELPLLSHGAVELLDASTFRTIDRYELAKNEQGLCIKSISLTIATEYTKKKRPCLAVSSGLLRGEDLAMRGAVYVFDVVEVVPEVSAPDAKYRLKCLCREEVRAAATTLCEVDGFLLSSQGQKVVVRSLEEDERLTPVAFVDLGLATTTAKCLRSMILFGDIAKGVRFVGFGEEPFKMTNFGRDFEAMDVMDAEFMVDGRNLYFAASDTEGNIRVLQYDPENPTTLAGSRLIRKADIHAGHVISSMLLLPQGSTTATGDNDADQSMVICASSDGSLSALIPVSERSYRRLYTIQAQLTSSEVQTAGLNPRAYRLCTSEGLTTNAARGILDGQLLSTFHYLPTQEQTLLARKSGVGADNVLSDLAALYRSITLV